MTCAESNVQSWYCSIHTLDFSSEQDSYMELIAKDSLGKIMCLPQTTE